MSTVKFLNRVVDFTTMTISRQGGFRTLIEFGTPEAKAEWIKVCKAKAREEAEVEAEKQKPKLEPITPMVGVHGAKTPNRFVVEGGDSNLLNAALTITEAEVKAKAEMEASKAQGNSAKAQAKAANKAYKAALGDNVTIIIDDEEVTISEGALQEVIAQFPEWGTDWQVTESYEVPPLPMHDLSIRVHGISVPQLITNARWWNEGVSLSNPAATLGVTLAKKERIIIHMDTQDALTLAKIGYPKGGRVNKKEYALAKENLKGLVDASLKDELAKGVVYTDGELIYQGFGAVVRNNRMNQPLKLESWKINDAPFDEGGIEVLLTGNLVIDSFWKKIRGYGLKSTLVPSDIFNLSIVEEDDNSPVDNWVILHSMSGLKGKPLDVVFFCHAIGSADIVIKDGVLIPTSGPYKGKEFDITKTNSVIDQWRNANAFTAVFTFDYARASWEFVKECDMAAGVFGTPEYDVLDVVDVDDNTVRITARVECLEGTAPLNIEVSLPEESSSATQLTPTTLATLTLQNRIMGEYMASLQAKTQKGVLSLLQMFQNNGVGQIVPIQKEAVLTELAKAVKNEMSDKDVLKAYVRMYPEGAVFSSGGQQTRTQYLHFGALSSIATFKGEGGDGITHSLCQFLRLLPSLAGKAGNESIVHKEFSLLCEALKAWFASQLESKSLRKKLVQTPKGTAFGMKVRTIDIPELSHEGKAPNCLPKAGINPKDDILRRLAKEPFTNKVSNTLCDMVTIGLQDGEVPQYFSIKHHGIEEISHDQWVKHHGFNIKKSDVQGHKWFVNGVLYDSKTQATEAAEVEGGSWQDVLWVKLVFNPYKLNGKYITVFRTPMPMHGACELVITEKIGVGHLGLLMHVWSAFNEGDSDGDGIAVVPAFHYMDKGVTDGKIRYTEQYTIMLGMNTHPMGMAGYAVCYGDSFAGWPCEEFCSYKDAWSKKKLNIEPGSKVEQKLMDKGILPYIRRKPMKQFTGAYRGVNSHYKGAVGTSYNLSVAAVYECLQLQYTIWNGDTSEATAEKLRISELACAVSWRMVYEGLGLAGFTPEAGNWFNLLNLSTWGNDWTTDFFGKPTFPTAKTPKEKVYKFPPYIAMFGGDEVIPHKDALVIAAKLVALQTRIANGKALENPKSKGQIKRAAELLTRPEAMREAILCRVDRITEQGIDQTLEEQLNLEGDADAQDAGYDGDDGMPTMTISSSLQAYLKNYESYQPSIACPWRAWNMVTATVFTKDSQTILAAQKRAAEQAERDGQ
jgi:hypothetical protein